MQDSERNRRTAAPSPPRRETLAEEGTGSTVRGKTQYVVLKGNMTLCQAGSEKCIG